MPTPKMQDVMVDIESTGKRPGCVVISIGAVEFSQHTKKLGREFYAEINVTSSKRIGLVEDPETIAWWKTQSPEARQTYTNSRSSSQSKPVTAVLKSFMAYLEPIGRREVRTWGCGAGFDQPILVAAFEAAGLLVPWEFWNDRCYRSLKNLFPQVPQPPRQGIAHNALDDAKHQARHTMDIFDHLRGLYRDAKSFHEKHD